MISQQPRPRAKIYQFPFNATAAGRRAQDKPAVDPRCEHDLGIEFGSGWYHEAALREADRNRKQ